MKKPGLLFIITSVLIGLIIHSEIAITNSSIPPVSRTGAPSEGNCAGCHSGNLNTGPGDILFSMDNLAYFPDSTYSTTLQVVDGTKSRFGFQITVLDGNDNGIGSFTITDAVRTSGQSNLGRDYVNQKNANSIDSWSFDWTAPNTDVGPITFYIAGNACNNNSGTSGDNTYTRSFTIQTCGISITDSIKGSYGDSSGTIDITVNGGIGPYTYIWSNGSTQEDLDSLAPGIYSVTLTDGSGCIDSAAMTVQNWCGIAIADSITGSYSDSSGAIDITITGGVGPYTYLWSNGSTQEDLSNLATGDYSVTVTDGNGCVDSATINVPMWIGVDQKMQGFTFEVFPNPSSGRFNVQASIGDEQAQISVYNLQGEIVFQYSDPDLSGVQVIDLSELSVGIYTLVLFSEQKVQYKKIVIH